jgi:hypothetical protein
MPDKFLNNHQGAYMPAYIPRQRRNLAQGTYSKSGEKLDWTYYDSQFFLTGNVQTMFFFRNGIGMPMNDGVTLKSEDMTNLPLGGQLPRGQRLTIKHLKIMYGIGSGTYPSGSAVAQAALTTAAILNFYSLMETMTFKFMITGKDSLLTLTLQEVLGANTLHLPATEVGTTGSAVNNRLIMPRYHGIFPLNTPLILAEQTNFDVQVNFNSTAPAALLNYNFLKIGLNGKLERLS